MRFEMATVQSSPLQDGYPLDETRIPDPLHAKKFSPSGIRTFPLREMEETDASRERALRSGGLWAGSSFVDT